jgi:hypothetical protein
MSKFREPALPNLANIPSSVHIRNVSPDETRGRRTWDPAQRGEPGLDEQLPSTPGGENECARDQDLGPGNQGEALDHVGGDIRKGRAVESWETKCRAMARVCRV